MNVPSTVILGFVHGIGFGIGATCVLLTYTVIDDWRRTRRYNSSKKPSRSER